ncbi:MAG TPA: FAD-dependent oxidoreductase, partial [Rubrobacter sp.]|nr:FAD-dependent oxidoreductase [Rubrobacter sp.]
MADTVRYVRDPPRAAELVIIGGGIVGAATAFHASRAGLRPVLLERRAALCTLTTPASTGAFRLQFDNREELELVRESVDLLSNFSEITGQTRYDPKLRRQGYLWCTTDPGRAGWQRDLVRKQHTWDQSDVEHLDGDEVRRRFPYVSPAVLAARYRAGDGFLDPKEITLGFAASSGADVVTDCGVTGLRVEGGRLTSVGTNRGEISTGCAVIAAGPFSGDVASLAGVELSVRTVRRHKMTMPEAPEVPQNAPMTIDDDTGAHWRPGLRGAFLLYTDPDEPPGPPAEDLPTDHGFALALLDPKSPISVARVAPFWRGVWERGSANWILQAGQYTITPDHRPLLGPTPVEDLYVNTGYSGHG